VIYSLPLLIIIRSHSDPQPLLLMNLDLGDAGMPWLSISIGFIVLVHILHAYLDVRQLKAIKRPEPPSELQGL